MLYLELMKQLQYLCFQSSFQIGDTVLMKPMGHESVRVNGRQTFWCLLSLSLLVKIEVQLNLHVHYHLDNLQAESFDTKLWYGANYGKGLPLQFSLPRAHSSRDTSIRLLCKRPYSQASPEVQEGPTPFLPAPFTHYLMHVVL